MPLWIYKIEHRLTARCYVGSSTRIKRRWMRHKTDLRAGAHHAVYLQRAWDKHGEDAFDFIVLETCERADDAFRQERETHWMNQFDSCFNQAPVGGTMLGYKHARETVERIAALNRKKKRSDTFKKAVGDFWRGKKRSPETIAKMQAAQKARFADKPHHLKGVKRKPFSEETRRKMSESAKIRKQRESLQARTEM